MLSFFVGPWRVRALGWAFAGAFLLSCGGPVVELAAADAPPPPQRLFDPHVDGQPLRFAFAVPPQAGRVLRLYASLRPDPQACAGGLPGLCIQLDLPTLLAEVPIAARGTTRIELPWPAALRGASEFYVQAAAGDQSGVGRTSMVWRDVIVPADDDSDHDGATAEIEHPLRARLDLADTDGGGVLDGQEILLDRTDPTDPDDDRPFERNCVNGLDDDQDALLDCEDANCTVACRENRCGDRLDDDGDGAIDCADDDCWTSNCLTASRAWLVRGDAYRSRYWGSGSVIPYRADVWGRVRVLKGAARRTCTWHAFPRMFGSASGSRFFHAADCGLDSGVLPPLDTSLWGGWYGPLVRTADSSSVFPDARPDWSLTRSHAGPSFEAQVWPACPAGLPLTVAFPDADGDGFGVSDPSDLHGEFGGRHLFCGASPPDFVLEGGDCDDADPTWSPDVVRLAGSVGCDGLSVSDRDGDGVSPPTDPDDLDAFRWGQEVDCQDGTDDDHDGLMDCEDADCVDLSLCTEQRCADHLDDDSDGVVDCVDEDCWSSHDCTSRLAWVVSGQVEAGPVMFWAGDVRGRVRVTDHLGERSCTWSVSGARATQQFTVSFRTFISTGRGGFGITPGCDVGSSVLPPVPHPTWWGGPFAFGWYAPLQSTGPGRFVGGPAFVSDPHGRCLPGTSPTAGFPDQDGDGYGVSDIVDLHGTLGGRRFACGSLPAGWVTVGGDCDDTDPTWTPAQVTVRQGAGCGDLATDDRDGDGVRGAADPNDEDATVR